MWFGPEDGQGHIVLQQKSPRRDPSGHFRKNADLLPHFNTQHYNAYKSDTAAEYDASSLSTLITLCFSQVWRAAHYAATSRAHHAPHFLPKEARKGKRGDFHAQPLAHARGVRAEGFAHRPTS